MPLNLPNRQAQPIMLEQPKKIGTFLQQGDVVDFWNGFTSSILPGEPFICYNRLAVSMEVVLPKTVGSANYGAWMMFLMNPAHNANILWDTKIYYSYDLAVAGVVPGYVTPNLPVNGLYLGRATCLHASPTEIELDSSTGKPIAWKPGQLYIPVKMHEAECKWSTGVGADPTANGNYYGNVLDISNFDNVVSS